jgi:hypothetical protein
MAAAPRPPDEDVARELRQLRQLYEQVPKHIDIKFRLEPGQAFISALRTTAGRIPVAQVASALSVTTTTVYSMRSIPIEEHPYRWPTDRQMTPLNRVWTKIQGRRYLGYLSPEHLAMHRALKALLDEGFVVKVIARRMKIPVAHLEKYVKEPLSRSETGRQVQRTFHEHHDDA